MKYLSKILFIVAAALGFAACADRFDIVGPTGSEPGDIPVSISFSFGDRPATRSMVGGTENKVHTMQFVCFDANGQYLGIRNAESVTPDATTATGFYDSGKIKGSVPQGTARIHFIANRNLTVPLSFSNGTAEETVMQSEELSTLYNDADHQEVCYWGYHKEASAEAMTSWLKPQNYGDSKVYLIRDRAKVILEYDKTDAPFPVEKIEWLIHNGRSRGYLAPKSAEWEDYYTNSTIEGHTSELIANTTINEYTEGNLRYSLWRSENDNDDAKFDLTENIAWDGTNNTRNAQYLFEDDNTALKGTYPKIIMKVTYTVDGSTKTVYHVLKLNDNDKVQYDIVRNNTYYVKCKLLSPDIAYYETLKAACDGDEFMNADIEIDRSITEVNDNDYTLQILLPTATTSIVLNTVGEHNDLEFAFRMANDVSQAGSTDPDDFEVSWEKSQTFCENNLELTYNSNTKQFAIKVIVKEAVKDEEGQIVSNGLTDQLQSEWIVVKHKASGLTRYIHVFVIDQFRYILSPKLTSVGSGDFLLSFTLPPSEYSNPDNPDPTEKVYPKELYPIDVKFTTNTLNAYGIQLDVANYGLFGVSVEGTSKLTDEDEFEIGYNSPISSTSTSNMTHWYFQQSDNYWDFWYTYSLKECPAGGVVNIYFKDVRENIQYATVSDVGLFLFVEYFGKNYSVPLSTN